MNILRLVRSSVILCVILGSFATSVIAQDQPKIITLGADLTPEQRQGLLQTFGAREGTDKILTVNTDEMRASMQDIIPVPEGYTSVSSTALTCGAVGSGLRVTTENITRVSAGMYAGALLTAGIGDAEFIVAAPAGAEAEGMTALTGIFKGFEGGACGRGEIDPGRRELAYRWLATTERLAGTGDGTAASNLMLRAQEKLVEGGSDPAGIEQALDAAASESGVTVPTDQRAGVVELMRRMAEAKIDWGTYAKGWDVQQVSQNEVRLTATNLQPGAEATAAQAAGSPTGSPNGTAAEASGAAAGAGGAAAGNDTTVQGTLRAPITAGVPFAVEVAGQSREFAAVENNIPVTRDGRQAQLADIQPNDRVTVRLNPDNQPVAIDAQSAATGFNWQRWWWLPLLLLPILLLPLLRRRRLQTIVVEPGQRTVVDAADPREAIKEAQDGKPTHRTRS